MTTACSMSPLASVKACLQSIIGAPVFSRRSFTCAAEIFTVVVPIRFLLRRDVACYVSSSHVMICRYRQETLQTTSLHKQRPAPDDPRGSEFQSPGFCWQPTPDPWPLPLD